MIRSQGEGKLGQIAGILVISYNPEVFGEKQDSDLNDGGYTVLLDAKQRIIYHPNPAYIGKMISSTISNSFNSNDGFFYHTVDGINMLIVNYEINNTKWRVVSFVPVASILEKTGIVNLVFISLLLIALIMILFISMIISRKMVMPIKKIIDTFRELRDGNFEHTERLELKSKDEIGELGNLFNSFIDAREDITLQRKLERQLNEQNRELQATLEKLRSTQSQMLQQEKLAAIGQLSAGVAHEINNPLSYVSGNIDMLKEFLESYESLLSGIKGGFENDTGLNETELRQLWDNNNIEVAVENIPEMMHDITEGLKRIEAIVNGLRSFSRNSQSEDKAPYDFNEGIRTTLLVANNEIKYRCDVNVDEGNIPTINANGGQINQVLLNIILNATYAIRQKFEEGRGEITVKTYSRDNTVFCSICDNGCGMSKDIKNRIFEPFFTTKPVGQGTGLGLGIAYEIICNQHNGRIDVVSKEGEGTCFLIALPIREANEDVSR